MNEGIKKFLEAMSADEELQKKVSSCATYEEVYAIASTISSGYTLEEFSETMSSIKAQIDEQLDMDDLAMVAGGEDLIDIDVDGEINEQKKKDDPVTKHKQEVDWETPTLVVATGGAVSLSAASVFALAAI